MYTGYIIFIWKKKILKFNKNWNDESSRVLYYVCCILKTEMCDGIHCFCILIHTYIIVDVIIDYLYDFIVSVGRNLNKYNVMYNIYNIYINMWWEMFSLILSWQDSPAVKIGWRARDLADVYYEMPQ